jgi:hypothetical protein
VSYDVDYKLNSSGTWINAATATTGTSLNLTGLAGFQLYDWRVRTNCSSNSSSHSQAQFMTAALPTSCPGPYDIGTNGTMAGAASIPLNTDVKGLINPSGDDDYYQFTITTGGTITLTLTTLPANYDLKLYNASGSKKGESKKNGTNNESITKTVTAGSYFALVLPKGNATNATSCYTLKIETGTASVGEEEEELTVNNSIRVYPNPVKEKMLVSIPDFSGTATVRVFDMVGKMLIQQNSRQANTSLDLSGLKPGIYLVKINHNGKESGLKIVKE